MRAIHPGIGEPQPAKNIPEHAVRTESAKMPRVADIDHIGRPRRKSGEAGPHGVQRRFRFTQNPARLFGPPELFTKRRDCRQRLCERRLALYVKGQREDRRDSFKPAGVAGVEGRDQNEIGSGQLQELEIRSAAQAEIGDGFRDFGLHRTRPELDKLGRRYRHDAKGHGCFEHRPVNGGNARGRLCPRRASKGRSSEQGQKLPPSPNGRHPSILARHAPAASLRCGVTNDRSACP